MLKRIENSLKKLEKPVKLSAIVVIVGGIIFAMAIVSNMAIGTSPTSSTLNVNVTNTPNVSVVNTPTVNIGAGNNVGITGTPNVNVTNTVTNPVPIKDVDNPARQPFQKDLVFNIFDGSYSPTSLVGFQVPSGKILAIEFVSAFNSLPTGQKIDSTISITDGSSAIYHLIPNFIGTFGANDIIVASQQVRLYAEPGSAVFVSSDRNSNSGNVTVEFDVSGYLVNSS